MRCDPIWLVVWQLVTINLVDSRFAVSLMALPVPASLPIRGDPDEAEDALLQSSSGAREGERRRAFTQGGFGAVRALSQLPIPNDSTLIAS